MKGKRILIAIVLASGLLLANAASVLACDISIAGGEDPAVAGETRTLVVRVALTHRNCITPIDETQITATGMQIVSATPWVATSSSSYQRQLTVTIGSEQEASLTVVRECEKGGDTETVTIPVTAEGAAAPPAQSTMSGSVSVASPDGSAATAPSAGTTAGSIGTGTTTLGSANSGSGGGWTDVLHDAKVQGLLVLTASALFGFILNSRHLRAASLVASTAYLGFYLGGCVCSLGAVQRLVLGDLKPAFVVLILIPLVTALLFGRLFCGWVCPMGGVQELVYRKQLGVRVPAKLDRLLRNVKYLGLGALIGATIVVGKTAFGDYDPFKAIFNLSPAMPAFGLALALLAFSIVIERPWCRHLCPLGAMLGIVTSLGQSRMRATPACTGCRACTRVCPTQALATSSPARVTDSECLRCGECSAICPRKGIEHTHLRLPAAMLQTEARRVRSAVYRFRG